MSYNNPPLIPRRSAPPPPSNFVPGGTPPPQPSRANRPSFNPNVNQNLPSSGYNNQSSSPKTNNYQNSNVNTQQQLNPPQPSRSSKQTNISQVPTSIKEENGGGFWNSVSQGISSFWGGSSTPQNTEERNELFSGATVEVKKQPSFNPNDPKFNQMQGNSDAQQQYYMNLAQNMDTSATQQALTSAKNSENIGLATLEELSKQADGLNRIDRDVESIHLQLDRGNRQIKAVGIKGAARNMVTRDKAHKQNRAVYNAYHNQEEHKIEIDQSHAQKYSQYQSNSNTFSQSPGNSSLNANDTIKNKLAEQDRQLEELSSSLVNLQNIAGTAGTEIQQQNAQLDKINHRTDQAIHRTHDASYKMQRLM